MEVKFLNKSELDYLKDRNDFILLCFKNDKVLPEFDFDMNSGFDVKVADDVVIEEDTHIAVSVGMKWVAPKGYYLSLVPKSGISLKTALFIPNSPATIEHSYRGDIMVELGIIPYFIQYNFPDSYKTISRIKSLDEYNPTSSYVGYKIKKYTKIAQALIHKTIFAKTDVKDIYIVVDEDIYNEFDIIFPSVRGKGGFGSTGL